MTIRVDFYILSAKTLPNCFQFACRLAGKAYQNGHQITIETESKTDAESLSKQLWSYMPTSFLPHSLHTDHPSILKIENKNHKNSEILINLTLPNNPAPLNCLRLLQLVPDDLELKKIARLHYQHYQQQGISPTTHKVTNHG